PESAPETQRMRRPEAPRCSGCGAKVGSEILRRALKRLNPGAQPGIEIGLQQPDDAAVFSLPAGMAAVQTVDFFPVLMSDLHLAGRIAAHHALSDLFAMGATPKCALALATVPLGAPDKMEEQLDRKSTR